MASPTKANEARSAYAQTTLSGVTFTFPAYKPAGASGSKDGGGGTNNTAVIASVATAGGFFAALLAAVVYSLVRRHRRRARNAQRMDDWITAKAAESPATTKGSISASTKGHIAASSISRPLPPPQQQVAPTSVVYPFTTNRNTSGPAPTITRQALPPLDTVNLHPPAPAYSRHASPIEHISGVTYNSHHSAATYSPSPDSGARLLTTATSPTSTMAGPFAYDNSHYYTPAEAARVRPAIPSASAMPLPQPGQMTFREVRSSSSSRSKRSTMSSVNRAASSLSKALASRKPPQHRPHMQAMALQERHGGDIAAMRISLHPSSTLPSEGTEGRQAQLGVPGASAGGTMLSEVGGTEMSFRVPNWQYEHQPIGTAERAQMAAIPTL